MLHAQQADRAGTSPGNLARAACQVCPGGEALNPLIRVGPVLAKTTSILTAHNRSGAPKLVKLAVTCTNCHQIFDCLAGRQEAGGLVQLSHFLARDAPLRPFALGAAQQMQSANASHVPNRS